MSIGNLKDSGNQGLTETGASLIAITFMFIILRFQRPHASIL